MENSKIIEQFKTQKDKLRTIETFAAFAIWVRFLIDLTNKYAPHLTNAIQGLNYLLQIPTAIRNSTSKKKATNNDNLVPSRKIKADEYLTQIIEHLKENPVKFDKKSFWETHFTVNSLATLWIATIAIIFPATYTRRKVVCEKLL